MYRKKLYFLILFLFPLFALTQNVQVDNQSYSQQQLIEDILINSDCISNVVVTNVSGGNFNGTDESYGFFDGIGTSFPFNSGIVLSTGRLQNVPGPNTSLSDDDATGWSGDIDLETILNESNTFNATILEFDFESIADQINFNYIFASEEYQEGNPNTCQYSDLFGFLIRPITGTQYSNIALVPNTETPVKVTTVHPEIPGGCSAQNEAYFGSWNDTNAPINFNGQTAILTATANVIPNETYHVKLVIADEENYRYDSAVFLEGGSFRAGKNLGPNRLLATANPLCDNEALTLDASIAGATAYQWFQDGFLLMGETNNNFTVTQPGTYGVEVQIPNNCIATGNITIEYTSNPVVQNTELIECDLDFDGITYFNLWNAVNEVTDNNQNLMVTNFFLSQAEAELHINPIPNPNNFINSVPSQTVYALVESEYRCTAIAEVTLNISNETLIVPDYLPCGPDTDDGLTLVNLDDISESIQDQVPTNTFINYYENEIDAFSETNSIISPYYINAYVPSTLIIRVTDINAACFAMGTVLLDPKLNPILSPDETTLYCLDNYPETIALSAGITQGNTFQYFYNWELDNNPLPDQTETININQAGVYRVTVMNQNGCSSSREILVSPSETATIDEITIQNNSISVNVLGIGDYEYNIDHGNYQTNNYFNNISMGFHTLYVRDKNGCGVVEKTFAILGFPDFFTPNGDGYNDVWKPKGLEVSIRMRIAIFDRYGKLLKEFDPHTSGWNGTYNGNILPNNDYWFLATFEDGTEYRGHFALKR